VPSQILRLTDLKPDFVSLPHSKNKFKCLHFADPPRSVAKLRPGMDNHSVEKRSGGARSKKKAKPARTKPSGVPFHSGALVLATLNNPREKYWGAVLALDPSGLSLHGIELSSFEDATNLVVAGEPLSAAVLFFPMHRLERMELDLPEGGLPSLCQRFTTRTGLQPVQALAASRSAGA
jgi:hypothetical protein